MRSRPLVRVLLGQSPLEPGATFELDVALTSRSETPTEHVDVTLTTEVAVAIPQGKTYATRVMNPAPKQTFRWSPGTLARGDYRQRFRFVLPPNAAPSYRAANGWCRVSYNVEVHVAIPLWVDRHAYFALPVAAPARVPRGSTQTITATHPNGPVGGAMYIEASVDATQLAAGEELCGDVSFANVTSKWVRRVTIALVGTERTREPLAAVNPIVRYVTTLVSGAPPEGESFPFRFLLPRELWPSFDAYAFALQWVLEVRADVVLGSDVVLTIPIDIVRPPAGAPLPLRSHRALPVGRQRLARLWAIVAQRVGLTYDEGYGAMLASRGAVSMTLAREAYEGTLGIVARYRYPHLGLDVRLGERGFFDAIVRGRWDPPVEAAKRRFTVVGRESEQLAAFFDDTLLAYLATTTAVALDDDHTELRIAGAASSAGALENVARAALTLLALLDAAIARIHAPLAMADQVPAWRAFADATSGKLELGRVWIHDATIGGFRFEVGTVWEPHDTRPRGTVVRVPIEPPLDHVPSVDDAMLSAIAREALRELQSHPGFHASPSELGIFIQEITKDPAALAPTIEAMTTVLRSLRGNVASGPFR